LSSTIAIDDTLIIAVLVVSIIIIHHYQSINHAAGDAPHVSLKKHIEGVDTVCDHVAKEKFKQKYILSLSLSRDMRNSLHL